MGWGEIASKDTAHLDLIAVVLGGIYTWLDNTGRGRRCGSLIGILIAAARGKINLKNFWETLIETGHITAALLFLITAASMYARMLGIAGLPNELQTFSRKTTSSSSGSWSSSSS